MLLTETNTPDEDYCHNRPVYRIVCSQAVGTVAGGVQGGVGLVMRERPEGWSIESTRFHGTNVVRCEIVSGTKRIPLSRAYLTPSTIDHILDIDEALNHFQGRDPIVMGDLNADIGCIRNPRNQQVAYFLASFVLSNLLSYLRQRLRFLHMKMWWQVQQGKILH